MFYAHNFGWGWWLLMSIGMLAFWALVIYGVIWLVRSDRSAERSDESTVERPEEILKRRLAQGEISLEEYRRLLEAIDDEPHHRSMAA